MNQKEKELFLELCAYCDPNRAKLKKLLDGGNATSGVLGLLFANRMAGVAYHVLKRTGMLDQVDREFRVSIRNASLLNEKLNEDHLGCVKFLTAELDACGIPYALLKGAYLCQRYPKGCRTSNDVDVLLAPEDVGKVSARLKMAGFRQGYMKNEGFVAATRQQIIESKMTRGETVPFIRETRLPYLKHLEVDLNFSLDYKNSDDASLKSMLSRTQTVTLGEAKIRVLEPMDFLLHLCAHLYKEATTLPWIRMRRDMTFYKYCDIYALMQGWEEQDLERLLHRAEELRMRLELLYCLGSVEAFFDMPLLRCIRPTPEEARALRKVTAPAEKKTYRYREPNPVRRFFAKDRMELLEEVAG